MSEMEGDAVTKNKTTSAGLGRRARGGACLSLVLLLAACGSGKSEDEATGVAAEQPTQAAAARFLTQAT
jgi:hypothetical protein